MGRVTTTMDIRPLLAQMDKVLPYLNKSRDTVLVEMVGTIVTKTIKVTPPSSQGVTGTSAKAAGENKVKGDINRVYLRPGIVFGVIKSRNPDAAKRFWAAMNGSPAGTSKRGKQLYKKKGIDLDEARRIIRQYASEFADIPLGPFDGGELHRLLRRKNTGRVSTRDHGLILSSSKGLNAYIKKKQGNVGLYASSLLGAANDLKISSVPAWINRHAGKLGGSAKLKGTGDKASITLIADTPFNPEGLQRRLDYELRDTKNKLPARIKHITRAALKKAGLTAAAFT